MLSSFHKYLTSYDRWGSFHTTETLFPVDPSWTCSTCHSRQCPGILPAGFFQCSFSCASGPVCTCGRSEALGFTEIKTDGRLYTKAHRNLIAEDRDKTQISDEIPEGKPAYHGSGSAGRRMLVSGVRSGRNHLYRSWYLWNQGGLFLWSHSRSGYLLNLNTWGTPPYVPVHCAWGENSFRLFIFTSFASDEQFVYHPMTSAKG